METIQITHKGDVAILQLDRGKVNAINFQMVQEFRSALKDLEQNDAVRGVILTGKPHYFSAGLDVIELFGFDREEIKTFFEAFGAMYLEVARFTKPLICAITGYSPAGGTVIAIGCDYRVMADHPKFVIGLNEVAVDIQISQNIVNGYAYWIGDRLSHQYLLEGKLLSVDEAFSCGLIDERCPLEQVMERAEAKMAQYLKANDTIWKNTKAHCRKYWLDSLTEDISADFEKGIELWWSPEIRSRIEAFVARLTSK